MPELGQSIDQYSILASASRGTEVTRVLKAGHTFAVFDRHGDLRPSGLGEQGLYHQGTRYLTHLELRVFGHRPLLLSSSVREDNELLTIDVTNPDLTGPGGEIIPRDILHIFRAVFLWKGVCYQRLRITNYSEEPLTVPMSFAFDADFADIFEVRGTTRPRRGRLLTPHVGHDRVAIGYKGLDGVERRMEILFSPAPEALDSNCAEYALRLGPQQSVEGFITIVCEGEGEHGSPLGHDAALDQVCRRTADARVRQAQIRSSNEQFDQWLRRSSADMLMMLTDTPAGPYPYAGVPWFSTVFGRDGIIAALQMLWVDSSIARGVLGYLAQTQATAEDAASDAEPGKIVHEMRRGEMAALHEIPFGCYYGSVDSTPLFVVLAGAYWRHTQDEEFIRQLWPAIERALDWIDQYGDADGDGFVEYQRRTEDGLVQQGWKDSQDSVFHADGTLARPPIALCEVQAYVYRARLAAADIALTLGDHERAAVLRTQAAALREKFEQAFWLEDLATYALALDGDKRPCRIVASNAGQCLFTGICAPERAARLSERLMAGDLFSGWGIRTVAAGQRRYNPMSYHNGSVWPHDNALVALGMSQSGFTRHASRVLSVIFDASQAMELYRLPELFCGFHRRPGEGPTLYPVACSPQAWASGAVFMLLQASLGMTVDGRMRQVRFAHGQLPACLEWLQIDNLAVDDVTVDLRIERHGKDLAVTVPERRGDVEVVVLK
ncbi:MAG: glycogen debranching N-terminal domain-containing protein [Acidobacteriota bacterium]